MHETHIDALDLNLLRLLDALLDTGNLTRAGDRLGLSQPAASRALARLRAALGDPLFVRLPQGLKPTPRAQALREPLRRALRDLQQALQPHRFDPASARGAIRIVAPDHEATTLLPALLQRLTRDAPNIDIDLPPRPAEPLALLADGTLDLIIGVFPDAPAGFRAQRLYDDDFVCVLRRGHPALRRGAPLSLARYAALPHALISITGSGGGAVDTALAKHGLARRIALRIPHFLAAPLIVAHSDLVLTMPRRLARHLAAAAPLQLIEPPLDLPGFTISQLWHEHQQHDARHRWLRQTVAAAAA